MIWRGWGQARMSVERKGSVLSEGWVKGALLGGAVDNSSSNCSNWPRRSHASHHAINQNSICSPLTTRQSCPWCVRYPINLWCILHSLVHHLRWVNPFLGVLPNFLSTPIESRLPCRVLFDSHLQRELVPLCACTNPIAAHHQMPSIRQITYSKNTSSFIALLNRICAWFALRFISMFVASFVCIIESPKMFIINLQCAHQITYSGP